MPKSIRKMGVIILLLLAFGTSVVSYRFGETRGTQSGFTEGYSKGQIDFAAELSSVLNETIDASSEPQTYRHFRDVKDFTFYVVTKNGVKTIATWKDAAHPKGAVMK